ncbi:winged helix-turn-helix domain-containing protein [Salipiger sp. IMCC34102]|uniref:winged helix-turn-helix domain-containing protein n=1 Tax=Salipiger sp. IMCC34102 TaxID=2510647 RepID=UPI00101CC101|nr:crosslink repair DNA glycosylase YcaQ family protein [Salipiger sp. IMCC34102]RYH04521.1 winged helix-turn-helix domain-containing protein [Salipiger sp. IMCC34102]
MTVPVLPNLTARRLFLDRHLLLRPGSGSGSGTDLARVIEDLGFVQLDSVTTLARAHDTILWARRARYRPAALTRAVGRDRTVFEHWTHDASVIPMGFYPMWRLKFARDRARMEGRWSQDRRAGWQAEVDTVLRHIHDHGPTSSRDVGQGEVRGSSGWWDWHPSKTALEYLWRSGQLAVSHRAGFRKIYDLAERVIPRDVFDARVTREETLDWTMTAALDRLGFATSGELAAFFDIATPAEAKAWSAAALAEGRIIPVDVEITDATRRRCVITPALLDLAGELPAPTNRVRLLSPFDPALRDRARARRLFGFDFRIEIFVPEAQRRYGYYVFPILQGDRLIGRLDAARRGDALVVRAFWPEPGVRLGKGRVTALEAELNRARHLANADHVTWQEGWVR